MTGSLPVPDADAVVSRAEEFLETGREDEAITLLKRLVSAAPKLGSSAQLLLGRACLQAGRLEEAKSAFLEVATAHPKAEIASLGLFHSLWGLGQRGEAFTEMKRFLEVSDSSEYRRLLQELEDATSRA